MANKIQFRRGQKSSLPTLSAGEPAFTTNTRELFVGTGSGNVNMSGNHWYRGTAMTGTSTTTNAYSYSACPQVKLDDLYLNTSNGNVYACTIAGSGSSAKWTYQGCIKGPQGATGQTPDGPSWESTGPAEYSTCDDISVPSLYVGQGGLYFFNLNGYTSLDELTDAVSRLTTYSSTPTIVGTWVDGRSIYRVAWTCTKAQNNMGAYIPTLQDLPGLSNEMMSTMDRYGLWNNGTGLIRENYCLCSGNRSFGAKTCTNITDLSEAITACGNNDYTIYIVMEFVA